MYYKWYEEKLAKVEEKLQQLLNECEWIDESESNCGSQVAMAKEPGKAEKFASRVLKIGEYQMP